MDRIRPEGGDRILRQESGRESADAVDFAFLAAQTFGDSDLARELLTLFVGQARRILASLPSLPPDRQAEAVHLLKGSARGIGAWQMAEAADAFEASPTLQRPEAYTRLAAAGTKALAAIETRLAEAG